MTNKKIGFIGGGRVTRIFLKAFASIDKIPHNITVSDPSNDVLEKLKNEFPGIKTSNNNNDAALQELVFISLHPPMMAEVLDSIKKELREDSIIISLAPKFSINKISSIVGGNGKIVRMIPNAPSVINQGYNPIAYSAKITKEEKNELAELFSYLGDAPEVDEKKLEAYAILCAMGPTYFWFQINELKNLTTSFGLTEKEAVTGIQKMISGALNTLFDSGLTFEEVTDLVPVKPLSDFENDIKQMYIEKLNAINERISAI